MLRQKAQTSTVILRIFKNAGVIFGAGVTSILLEGTAPSLLETRSGARSPGTDGADALQVTISEHVIGSGVTSRT